MRTGTITVRIHGENPKKKARETQAENRERLNGFVTFIAARAKRGRIGLYAAAISRHVANAFDRSSRKVRREIRWRWTLKWL